MSEILSSETLAILSNGEAAPLRFVVLIPHQNNLACFAAYRRRLFSAGVLGAFSLPAVAPLACVDAPLAHAELKMIAHAIRNASARDKGIICGSECVRLCCADSLAIAGITLSIAPSIFASSKASEASGVALKNPFAKIVLCAAVINDDGAKKSGGLAKSETPFFLPPCPAEHKVSFKTAAVANMIIRVKGDFAFEWSIGRLFWLPSLHE